MHQFEAAVKLQQRGYTLPSFTLYTLPPPSCPEEAQARVERIRARSREQYLPKSRFEVLDWLGERYPRPVHYSPADDEETFYDPPLN